MSVGTHLWMAERLGVRLVVGDAGADARDLVGFALRSNPRRPQLLVSRVLGKHVPADPRLVRAAGMLLGRAAADVLTGAVQPGVHPSGAVLGAAARGEPAALRAAADLARGPVVDAIVLGFAETATALGHCAADALRGADYLHSTRRHVPGHAAAADFREEHSHAVDHALLPSDPGLLATDRPLVLVDDELSTGRTALNTITSLHRTAPRDRYVVITLVDVRGPAPAVDLAEAADRLETRIDVVSLSEAFVELPPDLAGRAAALRCGSLPTPVHRPIRTPRVDRVDLRTLGWPSDLPAGGRHGWTPGHRRRLADALPAVAAGLANRVTPGRVLLLGTEELMYLPLRLARTLADLGVGDVRFSTTTRSPALVVAEPGYALTSGIGFPAHDDPADGPGPRYAYNLGAPGAARWSTVLVVVDTAADTSALFASTGLVDGLAGQTDHVVVVVAP